MNLNGFLCWVTAVSDNGVADQTAWMTTDTLVHHCNPCKLMLVLPVLSFIHQEQVSC